MKFQKGDLVWTGWAPDHAVGNIDARCLSGEILYYDGVHSWKNFEEQSSYVLKLQDGRVGRALECNLFKIPPEELQDKEEHETTDKSPVEAA